MRLLFSNSSQTKKPRTLPGLLNCGSFSGGSVPRDDRATPTVVDADLRCVHAGIAAVGKFRKSSVGYSNIPESLPKAEIQIFALDAPVIGESPFNTAADRIAHDIMGPGNVDGAGAAWSHHTSVQHGIGHICEDGAALCVNQYAIEGPADAARDNAVSVTDLGRGSRIATHRISGKRRGPGQMVLTTFASNTENPRASLPVVTDCAAANET